MKQVCDICQHLYDGPVCTSCYPPQYDFIDWKAQAEQLASALETIAYYDFQTCKCRYEAEEALEQHKKALKERDDG